MVVERREGVAISGLHRAQVRTHLDRVRTVSLAPRSSDERSAQRAAPSGQALLQSTARMALRLTRLILRKEQFGLPGRSDRTSATTYQRFPVGAK